MHLVEMVTKCNTYNLTDFIPQSCWTTKNRYFR